VGRAAPPAPLRRCAVAPLRRALGYHGGMSPRRLLLPLVVLVVAACSNKLGGDLTINGEKATLSSCRSGAVYGFRGVELSIKGGTKLRVAATPANEAQVFVMLAGQIKGSDIGTCGTIQVSDQNSTINDVKNVEGKVVLDCTADGAVIKGSVTFGNCH
jgi:hypothetical protein